MGMALLDDIGDHLVAALVVGGATGWTLAKGFMPPSPDKVVALFETPGLEAGHVPDLGSEEAFDQPGLQVRVRGSAFDYATARTKIQEAFEALHGNEPVVTSGEPLIVYINAVQSAPLPMGLDGSNRPEMTWNFIMMRQRGE